MTNFPEWLSGELKHRGWKQIDLAEFSGIAQTSISRVMSGMRSPGPNMCNQIAKALKVPPEEVFKAAGLIDSPALPEDKKTFREILEITKAMSDDQLKEAVNYLRYLVQRPS